MAFTTLEQRFNASAREIYGRFSNQSDSATEIKPDSAQSKSRIKDDSRLTPFVSTVRDTSRISKFLGSNKGVLFLAKQTLLQTGNTFAETRLYNPLEALLNVPPSIFVRRNFGFPSILGKSRGALQRETIDSFKNGASGFIQSVVNTALSPIRALNAQPTQLREKYFERPEDNANWYPRLLAKQDITDQGIKRPAGLYAEQSSSTDFYLRKFSYVDQVQSGSRTFRDLENTGGYFALGDIYNYVLASDRSTDKQNLFQNQISYSTIIDHNTSQIDSTNNVNADIIKFIFSDADGTNPIHFRAFISSIKENVKPEYNEQRYVGRVERFVTYAGAKRSVSLQFNIAAMTAAELDSMWLRINNLSGRAFPKAISRNGFMVPPLFRMTIGNIYKDQPCYIDNLDFDFLDESIVFDVDREVSQVINVQMNLVLLEKRTKTYDSPFYEITQAMEGTKERVSQTPVTPAVTAGTPPTPPTPSPAQREEGRRERVATERAQSSQGTKVGATPQVPINPNGPPTVGNVRTGVTSTTGAQRPTTPFQQAFPQFGNRSNYNPLLTRFDVNLDLAVRRTQAVGRGTSSVFSTTQPTISAR